jgi:hypothetical protein
MDTPNDSKNIARWRQERDQKNIARLALTFRPFEHIPDAAVCRYKCDDGAWIVLTMDELRTRPDFDKPVNATKEQKRKWEAHIVLWTLEWLDAVLEAPVHQHHHGIDEEQEELFQIIERAREKDTQRQRKIEAILAEFPEELQRKPAAAPPAAPPAKHPRQTQERERDTADWARKTVRAIWFKKLGRQNKKRGGPEEKSDLVAKIVARWMKQVSDNNENKRLKETCWVKEATPKDIRRLVHKSGPSGLKKKR